MCHVSSQSETCHGTTISIVLTFGTATWIERKETDKARRLLAMTIISDIDQSLEVVGDTLVKTFDMQTLKIDNDESDITCSKEERENQLPGVRQLYMDRLTGTGFIKRINTNNRVAQATNLDRTGTRLELTEADMRPVHYQKKDNLNNNK